MLCKVNGKYFGKIQCEDVWVLLDEPNDLSPLLLTQVVSDGDFGQNGLYSPWFCWVSCSLAHSICFFAWVVRPVGVFPVPWRYVMLAWPGLIGSWSGVFTASGWSQVYHWGPGHVVGWRYVSLGPGIRLCRIAGRWGLSLGPGVRVCTVVPGLLTCLCRARPSGHCLGIRFVHVVAAQSMRALG